MPASSHHLNPIIKDEDQSQESMRDPNSVANILSFVTKHIRLNWTINFSSSKIYGTATLTMSRLSEEMTVKLDCSHLNVKRVTDLGNGQNLNFSVEPRASKFGGLLAVDLATREDSHEIQ